MSLVLYKFRSLSRIERVLDILLNEQLYCCPYAKLNDPFEGQFRSIFGNIQIGQGTMLHPGANFETLSTIDEVDDARIASLSAAKTDVRMWSHYADGHKGVAIEIDCSDLDVREVRYRPGLLAYQQNIHSRRPERDTVLTRKTPHWCYEKEYRVIGTDEYLSVADRIRRVLLGIHVSADSEALLRKAAPKYAYHRMTLDPNTLEVRDVA